MTMTNDLTTMLADLDAETYEDRTILGVTIDGEMRREADRIILEALALQMQVEALVKRRDELERKVDLLAVSVAGVATDDEAVRVEIGDAVLTIVAEATGSRRAYLGVQRIANTVTDDPMMVGCAG